MKPKPCCISLLFTLLLLSLPPAAANSPDLEQVYQTGNQIYPTLTADKLLRTFGEPLSEELLFRHYKLLTYEQGDCRYAFSIPVEKGHVTAISKFCSE